MNRKFLKERKEKIQKKKNKKERQLKICVMSRFRNKVMIVQMSMQTKLNTVLISAQSYFFKVIHSPHGSLTFLIFHAMPEKQKGNTVENGDSDVPALLLCTPRNNLQFLNEPHFYLCPKITIITVFITVDIQQVIYSKWLVLFLVQKKPLATPIQMLAISVLNKPKFPVNYT